MIERYEEMGRVLEGLHWQRIEISDEIYVLNPDVAVEEGVRHEIAHAKANRKGIRSLKPLDWGLRMWTSMYGIFLRFTKGCR